MILLVIFFSDVRFCILWSNFAWLSTMNSESTLLIYFPAVFKFLLMQRGLVTTHTLFLFSTRLKFLVVSLPLFSLLHVLVCITLMLRYLLVSSYFAGTLDEHMHLLLPALIRLFKLDASVEVRRGAIKTLTRLIPRVQVGVKGSPSNFIFSIWWHIFVTSFLLFVSNLQVTGHISSLVHHLKLVLDGSDFFFPHIIHREYMRLILSRNR